MNPIEKRGKDIANHAQIRFDGQIWKVPSQSKKGDYTVDLEQGACTCPYYESWRRRCKHIIAVEEKIKREHALTITMLETFAASQKGQKSKRQKRNWRLYNEWQTGEKQTVEQLAFALCQSLSKSGQEPPKLRRGRPFLALDEVVFCLIMKVYETFAVRRAMSDLNSCEEREFILHKPHFNTIGNYLKREAMTPLLSELVTRSSLPLSAIETRFAVDSSGFRTSGLHTWNEVKYGNTEQWHGFVKSHLVCGLLTNIVVAVIVTPMYSNDSPYLIPLIQNVSRYYRVEEILADLGYSSRENLKYIDSIGATPLIPFKKNARADSTSELWNKLFNYYSLHREEFNGRYHQRSRVESVFSAIKRKFGEKLRSRCETAQTNELLVKIICYNLGVLAKSIAELGIDPSFGSLHETTVVAAESEAATLAPLVATAACGGAS